MNKLIKVLFVQSMQDEQYEIESLWCIADGNNYVIDNIPFIAYNISYGDVIKVELVEKENAYYFEELIMASGNSTVRLLFDDIAQISSVRESLSLFGCESEAFLDRNLLAINILKDVDYLPLKLFLDDGERGGKWQYEESCLSHEY
jgi:hypothetical protein